MGAPDGSSVTTIRMPLGYHNVSNLGYVIHWGDTSQMEFDDDLAQRQIRNAVEALKPMAHTPELLLMNGIDHAEAEPRIPEIIARANAEATKSNSTTAPWPSTWLGAQRQGPASQILRRVPLGALLGGPPGCYATRIYLKQTNHRVESLMNAMSNPWPPWPGSPAPTSPRAPMT